MTTFSIETASVGSIECMVVRLLWFEVRFSAMVVRLFQFEVRFLAMRVRFLHFEVRPPIFSTPNHLFQYNFMGCENYTIALYNKLNHRSWHGILY